MLLKLCVMGLCAFLLAAGCGRKEEDPEPGPAPEPETRRIEPAPEGFARIEDDLFMTLRPPRIEKYVNFLESTGQQLPERLKSPDVNYQDPVTGLPEQEAQRFATWLLLRLPSRQEWRRAESVVGPVPYPWNDETPEDAPLYLIRDWTEGSEAHAEARRAREDLATELLSQRQSEVEMGRNMLNNLVESKSEDIGKQWQEFKSALTELIELQKLHAREAAATEGRRTVLQILERVGEEKRKVIHAKFDETAPPDALRTARDQYGEFLDTRRNDVEELRQRVVADNQEISTRARNLMGNLEEIGDDLTGRLQQISGEADVPAAEIQQMEKLAQLRNRLQETMSQVRVTASDILDTLRTAQQRVETQAAELEERIENLPDEQTTSERIQQVQDSILALNRNLEEQFVQEPHLFQELREYTELTATKRALEREVEVMENMLGLLQQAAEGGEALR